MMRHQHERIEGVQLLVASWSDRHRGTLLRVSLGLVFLGFGLLKFFPGASPAEELVQETVGELTLGLISERAGVLLVAALESAIGLSLLTGRHVRLGLGLLGLAMVGILSPLVVTPETLFRPDTLVPTLAGQYVIKDVVLLAAGLVLAGSILGRSSRPDLAASTATTAPRRREDRQPMAA